MTSSTAQPTVELRRQLDAVQAGWAHLDPPATPATLLAMSESGEWASPEHRRAYDLWAPLAGRLLLATIHAETGVDPLEGT